MRDFSVLEELPSDNEIGFTNELLSCIKIGVTKGIARVALSATGCIGCNKVGLSVSGKYIWYLFWKYGWYCYCNTVWQGNSGKISAPLLLDDGPFII